MKNRKEFPVVLIGLFNVDFGIRYISSFLKTKGYSTYIILFNQMRYTVEFFDNDYFTAPVSKHKICPEEDLRLLINILKQLKPKLIGLSVTSVTMRTAQIITSEIKKHLDTIIVWGGIHAIIAPEECIQYADIVCIGEGEVPMWELVKKLRDNQPLRDIKNLWIKNSEGIENNEIGPLIEDLDALPFPDFIERGNKFLIDSGKIIEDPPIMSAHEKNIYPIMTSRGCMFSCTYCCNSVISKRYNNKGAYLRRRSVKNVIDELRFAIENKPINTIRFWDDIFTYDKNWIEEFCSRYLAEIGKPFACYTNPKYTDREMFIRLAKSGLIFVCVGIQSGSEYVNMNVFARNQSNQEILDFVEKLKELHIITRYDLITDNPYETERDQNNTIDLLLKLPHPYRIQIYSLCYLPKTTLTEKALNDKLITTQDLEQYSSKALNNFYMFLSLSKNKRQFFWNCIKAMAVNRHFPKSIVRLCKRISLFKKYPQLLALLGSNYLRLFKPIRKTFPIILASSKPSYINLEEFVAFGKSKFLFVKEKIIFTLFPSGNVENCKRFCLRITNKVKTNLFLQFLIEIFPIGENRVSTKTVWGKIKLEIKANSQSNLYLDLEYPKLYYSFDRERKQLRLLRRDNFKSGDERLYVVRIKYRFLERFITRRFGYLIAESILCNIKI